MYAVADDLAEAIKDIHLDRLCVVEESPDYKGELCFQVQQGAEQLFYSTYREWISRFLVLNELYNLPAFVTQLSKDGWEVVFGPSCGPILADMMRWAQPLKVEGYNLYPFQQFALNRALETDFFFYNWSPGAGKTAIAAPIGARELFSRDKIDLVLAFTPAPLKIGLLRFFARAGLDVVLNEGTPAKRRKVYRENHQGFVLNYERLRVDEDELKELILGKRVLFVLDEAHRLLAGQRRPNRARKAFDRLVRLTEATVWPMSATVVDGDPLRYRDVFSLNGQPRHNPLGTRAEFEQRYADRVRNVTIQTRTGGSFEATFYDWNRSRLQEVRHRVGDRTHAVRKTDPGLVEIFKGVQHIEVPVQLSDEDRRLYAIITGYAEEAWARGESLAPFYRLMRYACLTPEALAHTDEEIGRQIAAENPKLVTSAHSAKIAVINEMLEGFQDAGDKAVVFCHWVGMGLHLVKNHLTVPYLEHHGDQAPWERQEAIDRFQADPDITALVCSDAGAHGLNLTAARIVVQIDPVYSFDLAMQRASRIDRADSHLDGLTNFQLLVEDSVEERIWRIQQERRSLSSAVQGTVETIDVRAGRSETENLEWLVLGR